MPMPTRLRVTLVHICLGTAGLGRAPGGVVPGSCSLERSKAPAVLLVTGGLKVTRVLGRVSFFRFFIIIFFFLMTRIRTCCCEVPGDQKGTAPEEGRMA